MDEVNAGHAGGRQGNAGRRATIKDVAALAGVSRSTASRALTGHGYVAPGVRTKVLAAAAELRYVVDVMARNLKQQTSRTIGVLVSDLRNSFYADMASGIGASARRAGYTMFLADDGGDAVQEAEAAERFVALRVAGVVVTPVSAQIAEYLGAHGVPVIEMDRQFAAGRCDAVVVDNRAGARDVTEHLLAQGHRRIALFIDETDWTTGRERQAGYREAFERAGVPVEPDLVVSSGWSLDNARQAARELLQGPTPPTAVFAANNVLAEGVYRAALDLEMTVPGDVSLVSFDDAPWMSMVRPGITVVAQDAAALGDAAVERLLGRIENPDAPPRTVVLPARIVNRGSTTPPALHV
ncbi:LacI family DNA-binding transcriptional regulator [Oerskovia sp. KBS0722]|uniref:LacI family DNA-binding transcriptional regulator n=1 Tax=Oerskovia sp. KBS0722 TaxID=1179673 RepID=UPI001FEDC6F3|nr:LacI family DNA-binding transcriptional regulator [Oerskovia sp. KBS0722]